MSAPATSPAPSSTAPLEGLQLVPQGAPGTTTRVGFSTPRYFNPVSWLVRTITGSKASHAFFVYHDADFDLDMVMEAHELGFRLTPLKHFERHNKIVKLVAPKHVIDVGLKHIARRYLGSEYDFAGLFGMGWVMFGRFLKRKWKNPWRGSKSVYCSESVILAMKFSPGYEKVDLIADSSPQDLYDWFEKAEGS
ncbi:MAG TPA: hypothetical protein VFA20_07330 [Myxococcaceae bacterium]|nr:hypothetical protein [Myxococcaceae bacterium]